MQEYYRSLKDSIQEGIILFKENGEILDVNKNIEMTMDCSLSEHSSLSDILPEKISKTILEMSDEVKKNIFSAPRPIALINKNGVRIPFLLSVELSGGGVFLAVFKELISNEEMHKFAWENEIKGHYLSMIARFLYLPLHNMERNIEYAQEALESSDMNALREFLTDMGKEVEKIAQAFEDILDLSIIDRVTNKILFKTASLNKIVKKVVDIASADFSNIEFDMPRKNYNILGDTRSLEYLFLTIIDQQLQTASPSDKIEMELEENEDYIIASLHSTHPISNTLIKGLVEGKIGFRNIKLDIAGWVVTAHGIEFAAGKNSFSVLFKKEDRQ